jgi:hypothetical protein
VIAVIIYGGGHGGGGGGGLPFSRSLSSRLQVYASV